MPVLVDNKTSDREFCSVGKYPVREKVELFKINFKKVRIVLTRGLA